MIASARPATALRMGLREQRRRPFFLLLLAVVPFVFITWSIVVTEPLPRQITLPGGEHVATTMKQLHGAVMVPITVGFLAGLIGMFTVRSALRFDRRLVVAGFRPIEVIAPRLLVVLAATLVVLAVSLAVTAIDFSPRRWGTFATGTLLAGLTYGAIGAIAGAMLGRLGGAYFMFFLPMVDFGVAQNPMFFDGEPPGWAIPLPGYGSTRVLVDGAFSTDFTAGAELAIGSLWLAIAVAGVVAILRRAVAAEGTGG